MISYYKHTNGESFTLNDRDYVGFFTVIDGIAYTGKNKTESSEILKSKNTFLSKFYLNMMEFDNNSDNVEDIAPYYANSFNLFNKNELINNFEKIDRNNLIVFKSLIVSNPDIVSFDSNDCHFYGLSSTAIDTRNDDIMTGKKVVSQIDRFDFSPEWNFLNNVMAGDFVVKSDQSFKYLCSTGGNLITITGSFIDTAQLQYEIQELELGKLVYDIKYDDFENVFYIVINDEIIIYEGLNFIECSTFVIKDRIKINDVDTVFLKWRSNVSISNNLGKFSSKFYNINKNNVEFMKYGNKLRTTLSGNTLTLWNKKSKDVITNISLGNYDISNMRAIAIRDTDDLIAILHDNNTLTLFDPYNVNGTIVQYTLKNVSSSKQNIIFATHDSNIFYLVSEDYVETRFITNPVINNGSFQKFKLKYPPDFIFSKTFQKFGNSVIKWNTNRRSSNFFYNINFKELTKGDMNYALLHNSGRLYALKQSASDTKFSAIDKNLSKQYTEISCGSDSLGIFLNNNLKNIIQDLITLYTKASYSYTFTETSIIFKGIKKIEYDMINLRMNGNESLNTTTLQRIFSKIVELQQEIVGNLIIQS